MTTYQDIVDYMNKNGGKFTLVTHNAHYTINDNNDEYYTITDGDVTNEVRIEISRY